MASTMIKALVGLVALVSVSADFTGSPPAGVQSELQAEGSSAARTMITGSLPTILSPSGTILYGAHGSGAGKQFVNFTGAFSNATITALGSSIFSAPTPFPGKGFLAFGDESYADLAPTGVTQIPIAIGSIAFFVNLGVAIPAGVSLSKANLCTIFSGKATTWSAINSLLPNIPVWVARRTDASGSTDVVESYLTKVCKFSIVPLLQPPAPLVVGATSTSNMVLAIKNQLGAIGYAVCGTFDPDSIVVEIPVQTNASPPTAVTCQTASYSGYTITAPTNKIWSTVSLTAGTKAGQYPTANILFAFARISAIAPADTVSGQYQAVLAKKALLGLTKQAFQAALPSYFYHPLPAATLTASCKAIVALKTATAYPFGTITCPLA